MLPGATGPSMDETAFGTKPRRWNGKAETNSVATETAQKTMVSGDYGQNEFAPPTKTTGRYISFYRIPGARPDVSVPDLTDRSARTGPVDLWISGVLSERIRRRRRRRHIRHARYVHARGYFTYRSLAILWTAARRGTGPTSNYIIRTRQCAP